MPTATTAPKVGPAPTAPVRAPAPNPPPATTATTASGTAVVGPNGVGGGDLPGDQLRQAAETPAEATPTTAAPAAAVPAQVRGRRPSGVLGVTGSTTRTLLMLAGVTLLLGALIVAFGESMTRTRGPLPGRTVAAAWGESVPLAPGKRQRARRRAGIRNPGGAPGA